MAFDPAQSYLQGAAIGRENRLASLVSDISKKMGDSMFDPASSMEFGQLAALDPQRASLIRSNFEKLSEDRKRKYFEYARDSLDTLENKGLEDFLELSSKRLDYVESVNGDTSGIKMLINKALQGDFAELSSGLMRTVNAGIASGFLPKPGEPEKPEETAEQKTFNDLIKGLSPKEQEKAKRIKLGLLPRAGISADERIAADAGLTTDVAESKAIIKAAEEAAKLETQFKLQPKLTEAISIAGIKADQAGKEMEEGKSNAKALTIYQSAMSSLGESLGATTTGLLGWLPALSDEARTAEGAIAIMAPILKKVFRAAGEGNFTDSDQRVLMEMVPTRKDGKAAAEAKIKMINEIIMLKLSSDGRAQPSLAGQNTDLTNLSDDELFK